MKKAPDFTLKDQDGNEKTLADYSGKWLVLYFYPKDNTPGCTTEACNFRDERDAIAEFGNAIVVGISADSPRSHKNFIEKHQLNFTLLSDPDHVAAKAYNSWAPKKMFGKEFLGILRNTFIINPEGYIVKEYLGANPKQHAREIISDLTELQK